MNTVKVRSSKHSELIDITAEVANLTPSDLSDGICHVFCSHTTAGLTINENADPAVRKDIDAFLNELIPWRHGLFTHFEGNSAAHVKAALVGFSQTIPVENGQLRLGTWQGVYFCEFDGPRDRRVVVQFLRSAPNKS